jgi:microcystin-dependent protein
MAGLTETSQWADEVYQIEQTDPVVGGPPDLAQSQGITNVPHKNLADRTAWLKAQIEANQQALVDLTNGAPGALDTLQEFAAALGEDENFAATILAKINTATPTGMVATFASSAPAAGWLECDGATLSRTTYAALFAVIGTAFGVGDGSTTFALPDLRGEFLRGWDHGRGIDAGRAFASLQAGETGPHDHFLVSDISGGSGTSPWGGGTHLAQDGSYADSTYRLRGTDAKVPDVARSGLGSGSETRPRNVALMFCIKY